jgi:hypothetical protein
MKLTTHLYPIPRQEWWDYTSTFPYVVMEQCLINYAQGQLYLYSSVVYLTTFSLAQGVWRRMIPFIAVNVMGTGAE